MPGYCVLMAVPQVNRLTDLPRDCRRVFLLEMSLLGVAVMTVCTPRRINYEIPGTTDAYLHAHVRVRYDREPAEQSGPARSLASAGDRSRRIRGRDGAPLAHHALGDSAHAVPDATGRLCPSPRCWRAKAARWSRSCVEAAAQSDVVAVGTPVVVVIGCAVVVVGDCVVVVGAGVVLVVVVGCGVVVVMGAIVVVGCGVVVVMGAIVVVGCGVVVVMGAIVVVGCGVVVVMGAVVVVDAGVVLVVGAAVVVVEVVVGRLVVVVVGRLVVVGQRCRWRSGSGSEIGSASAGTAGATIGMRTSDNPAAVSRVITCRLESVAGRESPCWNRPALLSSSSARSSNPSACC